MKKKNISYPRTMPTQRRVLFEVWQATGDVQAACRQAHVSQSTFYYWKPRFEAGGYEALIEFASHAPKRPQWIQPEVEQAVIDCRQDHPTWGKQRIADELAQANNWVPLVSPNTVKRILQEAGLWTGLVRPAKKKGREGVSRTADEPGQTVNVDLCFVPADHAVAAKLPAVSGSSGRLVVEPPPADPVPPDYPGRIFAEESLSYPEAMLEFVSRSQADPAERAAASGQTQTPQRALKRQKQRLRQQADQLRQQRRQVRERRHHEDQAWQQLKRQRQADQTARRQRRQPGVKAAWGSQKAQAELWRQLRQQRQCQLAQRQQEDQQWRQQRQELRQQGLDSSGPTSWVAILVITDNCTRQCLGLPLFVAGSHLTAEMVVTALRTLLPPELQFLISDRGSHFIAEVFKQLAQDEEFIHVLIARHRPQSNGIAERFVRSLKEWLRDKTWHAPEQLGQWLARFMAEFNDRPHQGLPIPGLSPNEFAQRIWLF